MKATEQIYVTVELHQRLKEAAVKQRMTLGELLHVLLSNWEISKK